MQLLQSGKGKNTTLFKYLYVWGSCLSGCLSACVLFYIFGCTAPKQKSVELMNKYEGPREGSILVVTPEDGITWEIEAGPGPYFPPGDVNCDWVVDGRDIQGFMYHMTGSASGPLGDLTGDGQTLIDDVPCFVEELLREKQN